MTKCVVNQNSRSRGDDKTSQKRTRYACPYERCVDKRQRRLPPMRSATTYGNRRSLTNHLRLHHRFATKSDGRILHPCPFSDCGESDCTHRHLIDWHRTAVCGENAWRCAACATTYAQPGSLKKHRWLRHRAWSNLSICDDGDDGDDDNACVEPESRKKPQSTVACKRRNRSECTNPFVEAEIILTVVDAVETCVAMPSENLDPRDIRAKTLARRRREYWCAKARRSWLEDPLPLATHATRASQTLPQTRRLATDVT